MVIDSKMKQLYLIIWTLICSLSALGQSNSDSTLFYKEYGFEKYAVVPQNSKLADSELVFANGTDKFKTRIKYALNEKVNFAGHCIFLFWGCGTSCQQSAIIDAKTKKVDFGPSAATGFIYFPNSRLLVSNPKDTDAGDFIVKKTVIYIWENDSLKLLKTQIW